MVIDHTEALTVIDVNSSKYTGNGTTLQDTIFHVNKEAAIEIARQLRLRDIGGIIIIDFIDMAQPLKREEILQILIRETAMDCTKTRVLGMTALNLVEITRKKPAKACTKYSSIPATSAADRAISIRPKQWSCKSSAVCAIWRRLISSAATSSSKPIRTSWPS